MNIKDGFNIIDAQLNLRMIVKALQKAIGSNTREYLINTEAISSIQISEICLQGVRILF